MPQHAEAKYIIEPLDRQKHNRAAFSCGVAPLDNYLKAQAGQDIKKNIAAVYVLTELDSNVIIGYYTISATSIEPTMLADDILKRLPRYSAFPAILIGRLAVDQHYHGRRLGEHLLLDALQRCLELSRKIGTMAVRVDAKDETAARFYEKFGFRRFEDRPFSLYMPIEVIRQLT